ncbi:MAG: HNH endonuclease [Actinomycetota bacterium]
MRLAAFDFLAEQSMLHGDILPRTVLVRGFVFQGQRVPMVGPQGIFKPAILRTGIPLSILTAPPKPGRPRPYEDEITDDGLVRYRYRGRDPGHHENVRMRRAMQTGTPLIYLHGVAPGRYVAQWPVFVVSDDPTDLSVTVAVDDPVAIYAGTPVVSDDARRMYITRMARQRLHQAAFRERVLHAYQRTCSMCRLRHEQLLDAAHILPDTDPRGLPIVPNGLALCKLHHAAFDVDIVGVRPDLVIEVRADVLSEIDGPMLRHGLQGLLGTRLIVPRSTGDRPRSDFLEERYARFRKAV